MPLSGFNNPTPNFTGSTAGVSSNSIVSATTQSFMQPATAPIQQPATQTAAIAASTPVPPIVGSSGTDASNTPTLPQPNMIRNLMQSVQDRDVIKQASDVICYIEGQNYLINPYIGPYTSVEGKVVSFNDYVTAWSSTYDVDAAVPTGNLTLSVPADDYFMFDAPGGNKIIHTMAEIRVFAKGYYFSEKGNTVYHQIFRGYITSVTYVPDGTMCSITVNCNGALGLLDKMQMDVSPGVVATAPMTATPCTSSYANMDPYEMLASVFIYSSMIDGFTMASLMSAIMDKKSPYYEAVQANYVGKWQAYLYDLARDVHIFGSPNVTDVIAKIQGQVKKGGEPSNVMSRAMFGRFYDKVGVKSESKQKEQQDPFYLQLRKYHPDMGIAPIHLFNPRTTTKLERLRFLANLIGFEVYQDVDGAVIVKPPLYNLDVVNLDNADSAAGIDPGIATKELSWLKDTSNPFVVQLSEIKTESETEDEAGVRMTRIMAQGSWSPEFDAGLSKVFLPSAEEIDFPKLAQFGLRMEPTKDINWIQTGDGVAVFAFAASEMARANKGYRHYTVTIPMRPELKLGFPMYFPHKDIYGYIKTITMNWTRGQAAQTSVTVDGLRRRPLFPSQPQAIPAGPNGTSTQAVMLTNAPDLVHKWTKVADVATPAPVTSTLVSPPTPPDTISDQQIQMLHAMKTGSQAYLIENSGPGHNWRIQPDSEGFFKTTQSLGPAYYSTLQHTRPYTDSKGYELTGPFPWGRWVSLKSCLSIFTINNTLGGSNVSQSSAIIQPVNPGTDQVSNSDAFLFAANSAQADISPAEVMVHTMHTLKNSTILNFKTFELSYTSPTAQPSLASTLSASAPAYSLTNPQGNTVSISDAQADCKVQTFLTGQETSTSLLTSILGSITPDPNAVTKVGT